MALFTDPVVPGAGDVVKQDSSVLEICDVENIDLTAKQELAKVEIGFQLRATFDRLRTSFCFGPSDVSLSLANVVFTSEVALWHTLHTISLVYQDAYHSQLNDRYKGKWQLYASLARKAKDAVMDLGVGFVDDPVPRPAQPDFTLVPAPTESGLTAYISISLVNARGDEGASSNVLAITSGDGNAPDIVLPSTSSGVFGWNVFAGSSPSSMFQQNLFPIDAGADFVYLASNAAGSGVRPGNGQAPTYVRRFPKVLQRG